MKVAKQALPKKKENNKKNISLGQIKIHPVKSLFSSNKIPRF
jgi:hypothetical protein